MTAQGFAEFAAVRPLFELNSTDQRWQVAVNRRLFFAEESFPQLKSSNTFRIFVFGGSTVQGRPFSIPTSFPTFLEIGLQTAAPDTNWEVVNCGGISYASYRLLPIIEECRQYQPDLFIVCTGHNEFLECITYNEVRQSPAIVRQGYACLQQLHSFRWASDMVQSNPERDNTDSPTLPEEVDALLDHQGGLEAYERSALKRNAVGAAFDDNLREIISLAQRANVPLMLVKPPSNLRNCPPFKSEFSSGLSDEDQDTILRALTAANRIEKSGDERLKQLKDAVNRDEHFALSWYQLGQALLQRNRFEEAHEALTRARDEDVCPLRMTSALEATLLTIAEESGTPILDAQQLLAKKSRHEIVGDGVLVDHVHPSFGSNQEIAVALIEQIRDLEILSPPATNWQDSAREKFTQHVQSLDDLYFLRGRRTLKTLQEWTQGRADGPPLKAAADR